MALPAASNARVGVAALRPAITPVVEVEADAPGGGASPATKGRPGNGRALANEMLLWGAAV